MGGGVNRYSPPSGPISGSIFTIVWFYFLGQVLDQFFGKKHPGFLKDYYWTIGGLFFCLCILTCAVWLYERHKRRESLAKANADINNSDADF
jgi:preprotein translocase subunit SecG